MKVQKKCFKFIQSKTKVTDKIKPRIADLTNTDPMYRPNFRHGVMNWDRWKRKHLRGTVWKWTKQRG